MTHEHVRRRNVSGIQEGVKVPGGVGTRVWRRGWIAPAVTSAVVPTGSCERADFTLRGGPAEPRHSAAAIKNDRWRAFARTEDVQRSRTDGY